MKMKSTYPIGNNSIRYIRILNYILYNYHNIEHSYLNVCLVSLVYTHKFVYIGIHYSDQSICFHLGK